MAIAIFIKYKEGIYKVIGKKLTTILAANAALINKNEKIFSSVVFANKTELSIITRIKKELYGIIITGLLVMLLNFFAIFFTIFRILYGNYLIVLCIL